MEFFAGYLTGVLVAVVVIAIVVISLHQDKNNKREKKEAEKLENGEFLLFRDEERDKLTVRLLGTDEDLTWAHDILTHDGLHGIGFHETSFCDGSAELNIVFEFNDEEKAAETEAVPAREE